MSHANELTSATTHLVLTVIGDDRPGLVEALAQQISQHEGNWLESSMSQLAGKFAGLLRVAVPQARAASLVTALQQLDSLRVLVEQAQPAPEVPCRRLRLSLVAHDRIGIVREVTQVLLRHALNVESLDTRTASAPMSAEILFHADIELTTPPEFSARTLQADLEQLSDDLMVDIELNEINKSSRRP